MGQKPLDERSDHDLFRTELVNLMDQRHELARLADLIDWPAFAQQWGGGAVRDYDRPPGAADAADGRAAVPQARLRAQR